MSTTVKVAQSEAKIKAQYAEPQPEGKKVTTAKADVEVPFTEYMYSKHRPLTADYFEAPLMWDESVMVDDITAVEEYLKGLVIKGELENTIKAAKDKLKNLEKMANIDKLESKANRTVKLAEFVKYLQKLEERKYANYL